MDAVKTHGEGKSSAETASHRRVVPKRVCSAYLRVRNGALPLGGNRQWGSRFLSYLGIPHSVEHTPLIVKQHYTPKGQSCFSRNSSRDLRQARQRQRMRGLLTVIPPMVSVVRYKSHFIVNFISLYNFKIISATAEESLDPRKLSSHHSKHAKFSRPYLRGCGCLFQPKILSPGGTRGATQAHEEE